MTKTEAAEVVDTEEQPVLGKLIADDVLLRVGLVVGLDLHTFGNVYDADTCGRNLL